MSRANSKLGIIVSLVMAILIAGCVAPQSAQVTMVTAPAAPELAGLRKLAISPMLNDPGEQISRRIEERIANAKLTDRTGQKKFVVQIVGMDVTRKDIRTARATESDYAAVARRNQAEAILVGEVTYNQVKDNAYTTNRTDCVQQGEKKGFLGLLTPCLRSVEVTVRCNKRSAQVQIAYRVLQASDSRALTTRKAVGGAESDFCDGGPVPLKSGDQLLGEAINQVAADIAGNVIPQERVVNVTWLRDDGKITDVSAREAFKSGLEFAGGNRPDRACEFFHKAFAAEKNSPDITYNVGVCSEIDGAVEAAAQRFIEADRLLTSPRKEISDALARLKMQVQNINLIADRRGDIDPTAVRRQQGSPQVFPQLERTKVSDKQRELAQKERRVALVIGNSDYRSIAKLRNPTNDADAIAAALEGNGFSVIKLNNATRKDMLDGITKFTSTVRQGDVALVYFAGHGAALSESSEPRNFLLPVDFTWRAGEVWGLTLANRTAIDVNRDIYARIKPKARVSLMMIDACRNVVELPTGTRSGQQTVGRLLKPAKGSLWAFSASPGQEASDGTGNNGLFTEKLLAALQQKNVPAASLFQAVKQQVAFASNDAQVPAIYDELAGEFFFRVE